MQCVSCPTKAGYSGRMTDNLPARQPATFGTLGQQSVPLSEAPTAALAFALGYAVARPQHAAAFAPFCALVEELTARHVARPDSAIPTNELDRLMSLLPAPLARSIGMLYQAQRGQRWARTGDRHPK